MAGEDRIETTENPLDLDLNAIMEEGMKRYDGELQAAAGAEGAEGPKGPPPVVTGEPEVKPEVKPASPESPPGEGPEAKPAEPAEGAEPGTKPKETPPPPPKTRFGSHEEAEKGYANAQAEKTRLEQENAELKRKIAETEQAETAKTQMEERRKVMYEYSLQRNKEALAAIDALDPEDEGDYQGKVAEIWASKDRDVYEKSLELGVPKAAPAAGPERPPAGTDGGEAPAENPAWTQAAAMAREAGIDPADAVFLDTCRQTPKAYEDGREMAFDEQVRWAIQRTKALHAEKATQPTSTAASLAETEMPMGGGRSTGPGGDKAKAEPAAPLSLDDALTFARERRRL